MRGPYILDVKHLKNFLKKMIQTGLYLYTYNMEVVPMEKQYYIYMTTNNINGKKYIGQHKGYINDSYLGSGLHIVRAIEKYGKENFTKQILEICNAENIDEREYYWIKYYNAVQDEHFYNKMDGGQGGDGWRACNKWMKEHPEEAQQIYKKNNETLQKWQKKHPKQNEENIKKMLQVSHKYYHDHPEEVVRVMQLVNKGKEKWQKEHPEEYAAQIDQWRKAGSEANSKQIICLTTNKIFPSISEAARYYNTHQTNISKVLAGQRKSAGKHPLTGEKLFWAYYNQEEEKLDV